MKKYLKFLVFTCAFLLISTGIFASAVDSTTVSNVTTTSLTFLFDTFSSYVSAHVWTIVFLVAFILSEILANVKWSPKNSVAEYFWWGFKAFVKFFASKKQ